MYLSTPPIQSPLFEWYRVLKPGGIVYAVVPDKRYTWDRERPDTPMEHMIEDFRNGVTDCDITISKISLTELIGASSQRYRTTVSSKNSGGTTPILGNR